MNYESWPLCALFLLFGGCAASSTTTTTSPAEPTVEPPSAKADTTPLDRLDYQIVRGADDPRLRVEVEFQGSPTGLTQLGGPLTFGPVAGLDGVIEDHGASTQDGVPLEVGKIEKDGQGRFHFEVRHEPLANLRVYYFVGRDLEPRRESTAGLYRPVLDDGLMHFIGQTVFLFPQHLGRSAVGEVEFVGFDEPQWRVWSTLPGDGRRFQFEGPIMRHLRASVFCAGPDVEVRSVPVGEHAVDVAMMDVKLDPDRLAKLVGELLRWQRDFFADHAYPNFLVTVLGATPRVAGDYVFESENGVGLHNGFAAYVGAEHAFDGTPKANRLLGLLAHELLHVWFGPSLLESPGPGRASWFWEGFTTYYTAESLVRAGLVEDARYIEMVNEYVMGYRESVYRTASNAETARYTWENRQAKELAYERGAVIAAMLDREIRAASRGERSLDDLSREMAERARRDGPLTFEQLFALVEHYTSSGFAKWFRERAIDGYSIDVPDDLYGPKFESEDYNGTRRFRLRRSSESPD